MTKCTVCSARVASRHRYCPQCGTSLYTTTIKPPLLEIVDGSASNVHPIRQQPAKLHATQISTENKQVSVLFVDVCDSTALLQHADPEEAREYLNKARDLLVDAVETFGGTVSQLLGDGLVALFGAPIAHEDHALRACLAALKMQRSIIHGHETPRVKAALRVGIHSGEVIVGIVGQYGWSHYGADGMTIHIASRLEKLATPGGILISASTQRSVAQQIDTRLVGMRNIRGLTAPIELHEVAVATESSAAAPLTRKRRWAPLVGRDASLQLLKTSIETVQRSSTMRAVGLRGDAGVGKSRLIADWTDDISSHGVEVCVCHAMGYASTTAYSTAADLLASLIGLARARELAAKQAAVQALIAKWAVEITDHLAPIRDLLGLAAPGDEWLALNPSQRRRRIGEALLWLICMRLRAGSLVLVLEDVFLADRESQRLFESLLPRLENLPVLICVSYRLDFDHPWSQAAWFSEHLVEPLRDSDMLSLVQALLGDDPSVRKIAIELVRRSDGNPFFMEQLVITLIDDGSLEGTPGAYRLQKQLTELRVPGSIAAVIHSRVDRLPHAAKSALESASVLGDPITRELIASMQDVEYARAGDALGLCVSSGLLTTPDQPRNSVRSPAFLFRHAIVRDVVLGTLTRARLKALHRFAFLALHSQTGPDDIDAAPALAHHAFKGEEWEHAARFASKAMARAKSRSANHEALQLFETGVEASRRSQDDASAQALELALRLEAIGAMMALGHIDDIFKNVERADSIAAQLNDQGARASVSTQTAVFLWLRGQFKQALRHASQGLDAARLARRRHMKMAAHQIRLMNFHALGRYSEAAAEGRIVLSDHGQELAQHYVHPGWAAIPIINLYAFYASTLSRMGEYEAGEDACKQAYKILATVNHPYSRLLIDYVQGHIWIEKEEPDRAEALLRSAVQQCGIHKVPTMLPVCIGTLGSALTRNGKASEAAPMLEKGFADRICNAAGPYGNTFMRVSLGVAYRNLGRLEEAVCVARQAVDQAGEEHGHHTEALYELAETLWRAGDVSGATDCFKKSHEAARRLGMPYYEKRAASALAARNWDGQVA